MSTDLEFRPPEIEIRSDRIFAGLLTPDVADGESGGRLKVNEEEECHTPRSPRHMIPAAVSCPPAPKKRRPAAGCKRKLWDLDFLEVVAREEVESALRPTVQVNLNGSVKRKCTV